MNGARKWQLDCLLDFPLFKQFIYPCCSDPRTHPFNKILKEKLGYDKDYNNVDVNIWMLDKEVDRWGIELTMETPHIEWCFQFKKWKDLDNVKYVHVANLKAYKEDSE
jgi:hypothetical protein